MQQNTQDTNENLLMLRAQKLRTQGVEPYAAHFQYSHSLIELYEAHDDVQEDEVRDIEAACVWGRVMAIDDRAGDLTLVIEGQDARLQLAAVPRRMPLPLLNLLRSSVYRGDSLGFEVGAMCRRDGVLTGLIDDWSFLALANLPIPRDMDAARQRSERHLYWASSLDAREKLLKRGAILAQTRQVMHAARLLEVATPYPVHSAGALTPPTDHHSLRLTLVGGIEQVYEIRASLQAHPIDWLNHPQALLLNGCMALKTPQDAMGLLETLVIRLAQHLHVVSRVPWQPNERMRPSSPGELDSAFDEDTTLEIDLSPGWARRTIPQLIRDILALDLAETMPLEAAREGAAAAGVRAVDLAECRSAEAVIQAVYQQVILPTLIQPTFVVTTTPGSERIERFELVINGILFASGCREENDPACIAPNGVPRNGAARALMLGMPPATSFTLHLDRVGMLLLSAADIRDVIAFPDPAA
ncbi:MAG: hypothetical protein JNL42_12070 [Anaerolineae bacterium]|nr:hypothetical protein [Anaerolineae bacterium]